MSSASYVLFPLGKKRFAMRSECITELARPDRLHAFPHTSPLLSGVLFRRGRIVPVCDIGPVLLGADAPPGKFYVMIRRQVEGVSEWTAIPVTGECELVNGEEKAPADEAPAWVTGLLPVPSRPEGIRSSSRVAVEEEVVEVLDIERLIAAGMSGVTA